MFVSSHSHVKITTKLQNHHHWESPNVQLSRRYNWRHTQEAILSLGRGGFGLGLGGRKTWTGLVSRPRVVVKNLDGLLGCEGPPEEQGSRPHTWLPSPRLQPGREFPRTSGCKNSRRLWQNKMEAYGSRRHSS